MARAIGIDLGTTNSCGAVVRGGRPQVLTHKGGEGTIPSVFAVDAEGNQLVGREAKRQAQLNPENTVIAGKRLVGRSPDHHIIGRMRELFSYEVVADAEDEVLVRVRDRLYTLEEISAAILTRIREVAQGSLGEAVDQAVITVPAYFNDRQRQAVRRAGGLADLKVLRIINEPTAAALAYGLGRELSQRVVVYDMGGGTFDVSVIDIRDRVFEVIATGGDTFLGGVDFDARLVGHILAYAREHLGLDLNADPTALQRVRDAAENAKIELSQRDETRIFLPYVAQSDGGPVGLEMMLSRAELDGMTTDLVERSIDICRRILFEAGTNPEEIDEVLLVGGQSRMPLVRSHVEAFIGKPPCRGVHPDEAVGIGAAIMAQSLSDPPDVGVTLLDVLPLAIGITKTDGTMHALFQKNERLPASRVRTLTTSKDNQRSIVLRIYQGESKLVAENELLGTFVFSGIRPASKKGVQIEVTFELDAESILNLTGVDVATGQSVTSTLRPRRSSRPRTPEAPAQPRVRIPEVRPAAPADDAETAPTEQGPTPPPMPLVMPTPSLAAPPTPTLVPSHEGGGLGGLSQPERAPVAEPPMAGPVVAREREPSAAPAEKAGMLNTVMGWFKNLFGT